MSRTFSGQDPPDPGGRQADPAPLPGLKGLRTPRPTCTPSIFLLPLLQDGPLPQWTAFSSTNSPVAPLSSPPGAGLQSSVMGSHVLLPVILSSRASLLCVSGATAWVPGRTSTNAPQLDFLFPSSFVNPGLVSFTPVSRWSLTKRIACDLCPVVSRHC